MNMRSVYLAIALLLFLPAVTNAQLAGATNTGIKSQPTYPEPGQETTLTLDAYSLDTVGANIIWTINGQAIAEAENKTELTFNADELGETQVVKATIRLRDNSVHETSRIIKPSRTNLTIEANTHTPYFYKGRPEPSTGSTIRAIAIPETGSGASPSAYTYRWEVNGNVLFGGPLSGQNVVEFAVPLGREVQITLDILDPISGNVIASTREYVPVAEPEIYFYEQSLLVGESHNAIASDYNLLSDEVSIKAEPYFMSKTDLNNSPKLEWRMNNDVIANPNADPFLITLRNTGGSGSANISFSARSTKSLSQYAKNSFSVSF